MRTPAAICIVAGTRRVTFRELEFQTNSLADHLRAAGVGPEKIVGVHLERSPEMLIALLAIFKAGGAYLPLDPAYPSDRLAFMLADTGASVVLTSSQSLASLPASEARVLCIDDLPTAAAQAAAVLDPEPESLAYVIYTSGSTGRPNGVLVTHENLAASTAARFAFYPQSPASFLLLSSFAFDSSVAGIFWTLAAGGTLVLPASGEERDPAAVVALIAAHGVTHTLCLPSLHALLLATPGDLSSLTTVIVAGENCPPMLPAQHAQRLPAAKLFNEYGPTEASVWATAAQLLPDATVTIGQAIPGVTVEIRDASGNTVPDGTAGELHIGGPGVARGYLHRPELSAERFLQKPGNGLRFYKTGDLARRLPGGDLEFLGRTDHQVKIRGHRIELGAIEAALLAQPEVRAAAVVLRDERLVAYVSPADCPVAELRHSLALQLPAFALPAMFIALDQLPTTPNGKIDRAALPSPSSTRPQLDVPYAPPATPLEAFLAEEWSAVLQVDQVGRDDRFFEIGGDSLRAAMLANRLQQKLGEPVFVVAIFAAPTVAQLAAYLRAHYATAVSRVFGSPSPAAAATGCSSVVERIRCLWPAGRALRSVISGEKNPRAIFILAPPRSGTTLLRAMLAAHPGLATTSELRLLGFETVSERASAYSGSASIWRQSAVDAVQQSKRCGSEEAAQIVQDAEQSGCSTAEFFGKLQQWLAPRELVDKSPSYALDPAALQQAESIFKDAFYIHLSRHPAEMVQSFSERRMDRVYLPAIEGATPLEIGEAVWWIAHQNITDFLGNIPASRQQHIRFADLVTDPRSTMEALCAALGIAFTPALLDPYRAPVELRSFHTFDDPRFLARTTIDPTAASGGTPIALSDDTRRLAVRLGHLSKGPEASSANEALAIVGMAGRFPGARDVAEFWRNLCDGVESIRPLTPDELRQSGIDPAILATPGYVNAGAVLDDADHFAASFFGYPPREAELMDPQQRIFLECAWEAFEHAGYDVARYPGDIGVYAGLALNSYFQNNLATRPELAPLLGQYSLTLGNEKDFVATRVAHKLDLRGPAIARADRVLLLAGRAAPRGAGPAFRRDRYGAGRRRPRAGAPARRLPVHRWRHSFSRRALPRFRRRRARLCGSQWRRRGRA